MYVITFIHELNPTYYAGLMLDTFKDLLCSTSCWYNRPGPIPSNDNNIVSLLIKDTLTSLLGPVSDCTCFYMSVDRS